MNDFKKRLENLPFHTNIKISKREHPSLPQCFKPTLLGEYKLGALAQYRCGLYHAYEFVSYWLIHKDKKNPETHPWDHLVHDAPHWLAAGIIVGGALVGSAINHFLGDDEE